MTTLTWLGEQDYGEGETPLSSCEWNGVLFTAGDKVVVTDEWMIAKARGNRFFKVEDNGEDKKPPAPDLPSRIMPETWTNDEPPPRYPDTPPDYPPEDEPDRPVKRRRGGNRPPRTRENGD